MGQGTCDILILSRHWFDSVSFELALHVAVTFWPTPNGDGTTTCSVECELQQQHMQMECIEVHIPIPYAFLTVNRYAVRKYLLRDNKFDSSFTYLGLKHLH